jgi:hypothetical protein
MNRVDPALFSPAFTAWVRETWPERPELIASGRAAPAEGRDDHSHQIAGRAFRPRSFRDPLLHLLGKALGEAGGRGRTRPLGHREPAALGARRRLRRGPIPPAQGPRREKHGRRQTLRGEPIRTAPEPERPPPMKPQRKPTKPTRTSIKLRRKIASWRDDYLAIILGASAR